MALYSDFKPALKEMTAYLRSIQQKGTGETITSCGTGSIPAGFKSISIVKVSPSSDTVNIKFSDESEYVMNYQGEGITYAAPEGGTLPAYEVTGDGQIKWIGIK